MRSALVTWIRTLNSCLKDKSHLCRMARKEVNGVLEVYSWNKRGPCTERLLPSSSSLAVGASKQIMLGGCLALRRSFCASCRSRRSFVVSSNFCWKCRASVTGREKDNTHAVNTSSGFLRLPCGNPLGYTSWTQYILSSSALMWTPESNCYINIRECWQSRGGGEKKLTGCWKDLRGWDAERLNGSSNCFRRGQFFYLNFLNGNSI